MRPDHAKDHAIHRRHLKFQRRFGKADQILASVQIKVDAEHPVEPRVRVRPFLARRLSLGIMARIHDKRIIHQRDFLLRIIGKSHDRRLAAQIERMCKGLQRCHGGPLAVVIRRLDHHDHIGIQRGKDDPQRLKLAKPADAVTARGRIIGQRLACIIEQGIEPFHVIRGDPHQPRAPSISAQARLMSTMRRSASCTASSGRPRATIASGCVSRTRRFQAARICAIGMSGLTPRIS